MSFSTSDGTGRCRTRRICQRHVGRIDTGFTASSKNCSPADGVPSMTYSSLSAGRCSLGNYSEPVCAESIRPVGRPDNQQVLK